MICRWRTFGELERLALSIVADQLGQPIVVPELVVIEATAHYRRELTAVLDSFEAATEDLTKAFNLEYTHTEPQPDPDERELAWRHRLLEMCEMTPIHPPDAVEALQREVHGLPPARERVKKKPGMGARDAAIWLSILRDHRERGEVGYFITKDTSDFLDGESLKPRLLADLGVGTQLLNVHAGIDALLKSMGTSSSQASIDPAALTERGFTAIRDGLANSPVVPRAVFETLERHRFRTTVRSGEALKVHKAQRFARQGDGVTMVDAQWSLLADCHYQELASEDPEAWGAVTDLNLQGRLQVYLPEADSTGPEAQLIAAQLNSDKEVSFLADGKLLIFG